MVKSTYSHVSDFFKQLSYDGNCHILKILKIIIILKLSYKNMNIFINCRIFLKIVIFAQYDKKTQCVQRYSPCLNIINGARIVLFFFICRLRFLRKDEKMEVTRVKTGKRLHSAHANEIFYQR